jgi:hypothetical protein
MIDEAVSVLRTGREAASAWMLLGTSFAFAEHDPEGARHAFARRISRAERPRHRARADAVLIGPCAATI